MVGVLACLQGILRAQGKTLLSPARARDLLRSTGSPQQDGPGFRFIPNMTGSGYSQNHPPRPRTERIGNRPDLRQLIGQLPISLEPVFQLLLDDGPPDLTAPVSLLLD